MDCCAEPQAPLTKSDRQEEHYCGASNYYKLLYMKAPLIPVRRYAYWGYSVPGASESPKDRTETGADLLR
jgi:hypothetical protein